MVAKAGTEELSAKDKDKDTTMPELLIDFITSRDGYAAADGWPGWWGLGDAGWPTCQDNRKREP